MDSEQLEEVTEAPARSYPQLHKWMWGGVMVAVGALLPWGPAITTTLYGDTLDEAAVAGVTTRSDQLSNLADSLGSGETAVSEFSGEVIAVSPAMPTTMGIMTFTGALFLLFGLLLFLQMRNAIEEHKVKLGGVLIMLIPCAWSWYKMATVVSSLSWFSWGEMYKAAVWERLALDVGSGFLIILVGSTYVTLVFLKSLFGAASGGKRAATAEAGRGRGRRR